MATIALTNVNTITMASIAGATQPRETGIIALLRKGMTTLANNAGRDITAISMATTITGVMWIAITIGDTAVLMVTVSI
jgi:hypothetical protein